MRRARLNFGCFTQGFTNTAAGPPRRRSHPAPLPSSRRHRAREPPRTAAPRTLEGGAAAAGPCARRAIGAGGPCHMAGFPRRPVRSARAEEAPLAPALAGARLQSLASHSSGRRRAAACHRPWAARRPPPRAGACPRCSRCGRGASGTRRGAAAGPPARAAPAALGAGEGRGCRGGAEVSRQLGGARAAAPEPGPHTAASSVQLLA